MNINQIAMEMFGKYYSDLGSEQQEIVWAEFERRMKIRSGAKL
ncbi:MAG: hypothetical protein AAB649_07640 [Patescibacteria group bacterium]